jgi:hypothetical protein
VVDEAGMATFNLVWTSPETLPTRDEITNPRSWLDRVAGGAPGGRQLGGGPNGAAKGGAAGSGGGAEDGQADGSAAAG